jgi:hypothetical protein
MKLQDLKRIIKEEIAKVLAEAPQTAPAPPKTKPGTPSKPSRIGKPDVKPKPKAVSENEKAIVDKIAKRYTQNKKK